MNLSISIYICDPIYITSICRIFDALSKVIFDAALCFCFILPNHLLVLGIT